MAETTEAACLLRTGALYRRRLGLRDAAGGLVFAGFKRGACSLYYGDEPIYHLDLEGRWQRAFVAGVHDLKGLDGSAVAIERIREGPNMVLKRRTLSFAEASDLDATVRQAAIDLLDGLGSGRFEAVTPPEGIEPIRPEELREFLERVVRWDSAAWFAYREQYCATYGPLPFLPPEAGNAVILQATLGHADGLAFGGARPAEGYVRSPAEFAEHARVVAGLLGRRVVQCRGIFLAGADLLRLSCEEVAGFLEEMARVFPIDPETARRRPRDLPDDAPALDGVSAFLDQFDPGGAPGVDDWRRLRAGHLARVTLGVESGAAEVRALYGKTWPDEALRATVSGLKAAGIEVSLVALAGAGGSEHAERHVAATADLVNSLALGPGDLVYLIDADEVGGEAARDRLRRAGLTPAEGRHRAEQQARLKERLAPLRSHRGAKVVSYSLDKQLG